MYRQRLDWRAIHKVLCKFPFSVVLASASLFYGIGVRARLELYSRGVIRQKRLPGFVLSVGNITVGGTGKTPAVIMLARWAKEQGYSACVLSRGYKGRYSEKVLEVSDGSKVKVPWQKCGDEPYLLAQKLKGIPVVVSRSRYAAGIYAAQEFGSNFFILDDGFQHLDLARDFDLVLIDSIDPFGNGHLLPWGILREPKGSIGRAHAIIVTGDRPESEGSEGLGEIESCRIPRFLGRHLPEAFFIPGVGAKYEPCFLAGKKVVAFAGIGRPDAFEKTLKELGVDLVAYRQFPDHYVYEERDMLGIEQEAINYGADYLLTTEKDWIRVKDFMQAHDGVGYLSVEFGLWEQRENFFGLINKAAQRILSGSD